jgi:DNA transposition AAA+ family ATPase
LKDGSAAMTDTFVQTSIARRLMTRMEATHDRARISVFSGPPGIGKTTAIDEWQRRHPGQIAVVKIDKRNAGETLTLQNCLHALRTLTGRHNDRMPREPWELRRQVYGRLCELAHLEPLSVRMSGLQGATTKPMTIVFDEAQNLSRTTIEGLRYWSDPDRCYAPYPIGLIFVGNNEFSLASEDGQGSVISAAVADRALYIQSFEYDELTDADLVMVIQARGITDPAAATMLVKAFAGSRAVRSLRRVTDLIDEICDEAGGRAVSADLVREILALA